MFEKVLNLRKTVTATFLVSALLLTTLGAASFSAQAGNVPPAIPNAQPVISWLVANVSAQRIYHLLYDLQNFSTRYVYNTVRTNESAGYIVRDYSNSSSLIVQSQYFVWNGLLLRNVIAILPGFNPANKTAYVFGGHYDSYAGANSTNWAPGIDDDASGTVAAMEVARVLSPYRFNATLIFAAWTAEEVGLIGSDYHASSLRQAGQQVGATIGMDMIGNYAGTMGLDLVHDGFSEWIADALITANNDYGIGLQLTKTYSLAANSDHASFWNQGYNAIMAAEADFSPNWHQITDTLANVNITLITRATQLAAAAAAELAGIIPPGVGAVALDKQAYKPGDFVGITLYDIDLDTNPLSPDSAIVNARSDTEPGGEPVTLAETGPSTGVFTGSIQLITGPSTIGKLEVQDGDEILVTYVDADPPGTRTAKAVVDAVPPTISDVYAFPDIDSAMVSWKTDEVANSTVIYGETPALGQQTSVAGYVLNHSVLLANLKPGTLYYYDVQSADVAGNTVTADNGGSHFTFVTLTGSVGRPRYGYIGYVRSSDPALNFFTSPDILVGHSTATGRTYIGAAQLDTSATPIPPGAVINSATFQALGSRWEYMGMGSWTLKLLNSSVDAGWPTKGYTDIVSAASDATVPPTLTSPDLEAGLWNFFTFPPSQYSLLRSHVNSGRISFRFDGPTAGAILFVWQSGNQMSTGEMAPTAPKLRITYSPTGDVIGPLVTYLKATPNPTMASSSTTIQVTLSDLTTGGSNLSYAEYFWGADPGIGKADPLLADDGGYDSPTESATIDINVSSLPRGVYDIGFRGRDQADNWGPVRTLTLYVGVWDLYPPSLDMLSFSPPSPESGFPVNVSVRVTDDIGVYGAWANFFDAGGNFLGNFSMAFDAVLGKYYFTRAFNPLGMYRAVIWANDTSGKWNSTQGYFNVTDRTKPVIIQISAQPSTQNYGITVNFNAWVVDKFLDTVYVAFTNPSGIPSGNYTAFRVSPSEDNYTYSLSFMTLGQWTYCFSAEDTSSNWGVACDVFNIVDGYPPMIVSARANPQPQFYGQQVVITAWVVDQYIDTVRVNVTGPGASWLGNFSMTRVSPVQDNWTYSRQYDNVGLHTFTVWAYDESGNRASASDSFLIIDRTPPQFGSVQAAPDPAEVFSSVKISAQISDVQSLTVHCEARDPVGSLIHNNTILLNSSSGAFEDTVQAQVVGRYSYVVTAVDASFNTAVWQGTFAVRDTVKPTIVLLGKQVTLAEDSNAANVTLSIQDNYLLVPSSAKIEWRDPAGGLIVNATLNPLSGSDFYYNITLHSGGANTFVVTAVDSSGNTNVWEDSVNVVLGLPPVAVAGEDQSIPVDTTLTFNGSSSSDDFGIVRYVWKIIGPGVNETIEGVTANYEFKTAGTYTVTLTVYDSADRSSSDTVTVSVSAAPSGVDPIILIFIVLLVVLVTIALVLLLLARRKKKGEEATEEESEKQFEEKED